MIQTAKATSPKHVTSSLIICMLPFNLRLYCTMLHVLEQYFGLFVGMDLKLVSPVVCLHWALIKLLQEP